MIELDFMKLINNKNLQVTINTHYWDRNGQLKDAELRGMIKAGFGRDFSSQWGDLIPHSGAQDTLSNAAQGLNILGAGIAGISKAGSIAVSVGSVLQTVQVFQQSPIPEFSVTVLFFDATGDGQPLKFAKILELTQLPLPVYVGSSNFNLTYKTPMGYKPIPRDSRNSKNPNRKFSLYAEGLSTLTIGTYGFFDELIITGVSNRFSETILNTGVPLYVESTIKFKYWRLPDADHIYNSYGGGDV